MPWADIASFRLGYVEISTRSCPVKSWPRLRQAQAEMHRIGTIIRFGILSIAIAIT